ncbi:MAG: retropepsin-like aspartic protease [Rhizomicrobium sp.]
MILWTTPAWPGETCTLYRIATMDMGIDAGGRMTVPMTVGGQTVNMLVDTGGLNTMLSESVVSSLGLHKTRILNARITIYGGTPVDYFTEAHDISFGGLKAKSMDFLVLPEERAMGGIGGMLAPDILRAYDDDFDFANGKFTLFSPDHCEGKVVYWTKNPVAAKIEIAIDSSGHIKLPVTIDGHVVHLTFDTGADDTTISLDQAESLFGFDVKSPDLKVVDGEGDNAIYQYPFKTLTFGGGDTGRVTVNNPHIYLTPRSVSKLSDSESGLLGMGILRQLHLYIAYKEHRIFVTPASAN